MKQIEPKEILHTNVDFRDIEVYFDTWEGRNTFNRYKTNPRPCEVLVFILSDVEAVYSDSRGDIVAHIGDVIYVPHGVCYTMNMDKQKASDILTYSINFSMVDDFSESIVLSNRGCILSNVNVGNAKFKLEKLRNLSYHSDMVITPPLDINLLRLKTELYALLDMIIAPIGQESKTYYPIRAGVKALCNEWDQDIKIDKYADMCGISTAYFYQCFRKWSGKSPVEYRNALRLENAETLLRLTDMYIKEISYKVGFSDPYYFCRLFKQYYGESPQKYRQNHIDKH